MSTPEAPNTPLTVACTYDTATRKIRFTNARNCTYDVLKEKINAAFSLTERSYTINWKDDNGIVEVIRDDDGLLDAIDFFATGNDDSSVFSNFDNLQKITLAINIVYDGPNLSDAGSLIGLDEYNDRYSGDTASKHIAWREPEEDAVTISERERDDHKSIVSNWDQPQSSDLDERSYRTSDPFSDTNPESAAREDFEQTKADGSVSDGVSLDDRGFDGRGRNAVWLQTQQNRGINFFRSSYFETSSVSESSLSYEQNAQGKYYYSYTGSQSHSIPDSESILDVEENRAEYNDKTAPRPTSFQQKWLDDQQAGPSTSSVQLIKSFHEDSSFEGEFPFLPPPNPSYCSSCGVSLETIRYVCSTCGEKPVQQRPLAQHTIGAPYPPINRQFHSSSQTLVSGPDFGLGRPSPTYAPSSPIFNIGHSHGYELCGDCIPDAGIFHAIEASIIPVEISSPLTSDADHPWHRKAPEKGQLRHAYREQQWGLSGWADIEQDDVSQLRCSYCGVVAANHRYKCIECDYIKACRGCYSRIHEYHPTHPFLVLMDPTNLLDPRKNISNFLQARGDEPLQHDGIMCDYCHEPIIGARYTCVLCPSINLCSKCESAGLTPEDNGHMDTHPLIKVPRPTPETEVEAVRRIALLRERPAEVSYARTTIKDSHQHGPDNEHNEVCDSCNQRITGNRYQCANCPSDPTAYNLCTNCEDMSYIMHDAMHVFLKLPRKVMRPLRNRAPFIPIIYKSPAGPNRESNSHDPKAYLRDLIHTAAVCDLCMDPISGEWYRCAYCPRDLCATCEQHDTHDETHVFFVFKSEVNMQGAQNVVLAKEALLPHPIYVGEFI